jgi:glutaredoxin 3
MKIEIYGTHYCPYCDAAKQLLTQKNLPFKYTDLTENPKLREDLAEKYNYRTVPMVFIDGEFIGGFSELQQKEL